MAAPTPVPATLRLLSGRAPGRDSSGKLVKQDPGFTRLPPQAPEWLPTEAAAEWARVVPELQRLRLTKPVDAAALAAYCLAWDRLKAASVLLRDEGILAETSQGVGKHPAIQVADSASRELRAWAHEFGFTPSAEQRVGAQPEGSPTGDNPFG